MTEPRRDETNFVYLQEYQPSTCACSSSAGIPSVVERQRRCNKQAVALYGW